LSNGKVLGDGDGLVAGGFFEVLEDALHFLGRQLQKLRELRHDPLRLLQLIGDEIDAVIGAVDRDRLAVAVDDPAPARRHQHHLNAILFGQQLVALILRDRDIGHSAGHQGGDAHLQPAHHECAAREGVGLRAFGDQRRGAAFHRVSRQRSKTSTMRATTG
jgi:hypothetical protein